MICLVSADPNQYCHEIVILLFRIVFVYFVGANLFRHLPTSLFGIRNTQFTLSKTILILIRRVFVYFVGK